MGMNEDFYKYYDGINDKIVSLDINKDKSNKLLKISKMIPTMKQNIKV